MIGNAIERFRVNDSNSPSYTVYYKNSNGSCWCYSVNYNKKGLAILNPARRVTKTSYETTKKAVLDKTINGCAF